MQLPRSLSSKLMLARSSRARNQQESEAQSFLHQWMKWLLIKILYLLVEMRNALMLESLLSNREGSSAIAMCCFCMDMKSSLGVEGRLQKRASWFQEDESYFPREQVHLRPEGT